MSQKTKFKLKQTVRINDGVQDVDFDVDMGGWYGRISELKPADNMMLIAFDSITLRNMPHRFIEECEEAGLDWAQYYIPYDEVTPATVRDTIADVEAVVQELESQVAWLAIGPEGKELNQILAGVDKEDEWAQMLTWRDHLEQNLSFPFKAVVDEWQGRGSPFKTGDQVRVLGIEDVDDLYGVLVRVKRRFGTLIFPLCDLKALDEDSSNHEPVYLYAFWFANR